jgi:parvulin-like peptidyl-prolyl isomerase
MMRLAGFIVLLVFFNICVPGNVAANKDDGIVLRVGGVSATVYELRREMQRILPMKSGFHRGLSEEKVKEIQEQALESLLEQTYKVQYAIDSKITVPYAEVDKMMTAVRARFETEEDFQKGLSGESVEGLKASIYRLLIAKKAEELAVKSKAVVSDDEVKSYYEENKGRFFRPKRYRTSQIFIKVDPSLVIEEKAKLKEKADDLAKRAAAGEDFYNLAYFNSDEDRKYVGGDMGYFHSGQLVPEFEDAIKDLQPGETVGPIKTLAGFHVVKLTEADEPKQMAFEEVSAKIQTTFEEKRYEELYAEWMAGLKEKYPVEKYLTQ